MPLIKCRECGNQISKSAAACPQCGAPGAGAKAKGLGCGGLIAVVFLGLVIFSSLSSIVGGGRSSEPAARSFDWNDALTMCQYAIKATAKDPETAKVPYVDNHGSGDEYYYAWGRSTKFARMRNGLGLEVPVSASCIVDGKTKRITSLSVGGKDLI